MNLKGNRTQLLASALALLAFVSGCSALTSENKLAPGRCNTNTDCPQGEECKATHCQDIYYPRHEIKPY